MNKVLVLTAVLAGSVFTANAQEKENYYTEKASDNIFMSVGVGGMTVVSHGKNDPTLNLNLSLGKYITPTWGVRGQLSGLWQTLNAHAGSSVVTHDNAYECKKKTFGELNFDALLNLTNLLGGYNPNRLVDLYAFAGPQMNLSSKGTVFTGQADDANELVVAANDDKKVRFGASAGLGLGFNLSNALALTLEARAGVAPSIFGDASAYRKAECTVRGNIGLTYTFGGKKFKKVSDRVIEKEVIREVPVEKVVTKEVIKEVQVGGHAVAAAAVFFKINRTELSDEGRANIKLIAEAIKKSPADTKYQVSGNADKATGSAKRNQWLSEKRAQVVYDALIAEGVNPSMLEVVANGGVDPIFFGKDPLSRVTIIQCK